MRETRALFFLNSVRWLLLLAGQPRLYLLLGQAVKKTISTGEEVAVSL